MNYFFDGFNLIKKSLILVAIPVAALLIQGMISFLLGFESGWSSFISLVMTLFLVSYVYTLPYSLLSFKEGKKLSVSKILGETFRILKRLMIPLILFYLLIGILTVGIAVLITNLANLDSKQALEFFGPTKRFDPLRLAVMFCIVLISVLGYFSPIFYTLNKNSFIKSMVNSYKYAFKNLKIVLLISIFMFLIFLVTNAIGPAAGWSHIGTIVWEIMNVFIGSVLLMYYLKNKPKATN